jgi:hypothetical protein
MRRNDTPLILIGKMWADFEAWARNYHLRPEFELAAPEDIEISRCVDNSRRRSCSSQAALR